MITIIRTLNLNRQTTAILQNAYAISYEKQTNAIWSASFSLPLNDPKVHKVELLQYVEITDGDEYIGLFRVIPKQTVKNESTQEVRFQCEHVLATLLDKSLFKYHQLQNYTTNDNIDYLLAQQNHKHWRRGKGQFTRYFHYSWENTNLISALLSIPKPFDEPYLWEHDTQSYPWTLDLVRPEMEPICRIKEGYNLIGLEIEENPMGVYNRIYPLGAGEGINQLTIESVNNGLPYLEDRAPDEEIKEYIWADKRFTDADSLKASAQGLLKKWKEPVVTWAVSAADVSSITGLSIDKFKVGKVVRLDIEGLPVTDLRIVKVSKPDITGDPGNVQLELGNVIEDLSTTYGDLERRQQVNDLYSQGATNIDSRDFIGECDPNYPAIMRFYIPNDVVNINEMTLTFETQNYRAYSKAIEGGGAIVSSTESGGAIVKSTESGGEIVKSTTGGGGTTVSSSNGGGTTASSTSGGGIAKSTESGGGSSPTSSSGGGVNKSTLGGGSSAPTSEGGGGFSKITNPYWDPTEGVIIVTGVQNGTGASHVHDLPIQLLDHTHKVSAPDHTHKVNISPHTHSFSTPNHSHTVSIPSHTHSFNIPNHSHDVTIPNHTHSVTIPNHSHDVHLPAHLHEIKIPDHKHEIILPNHVHAIKHGIFEYGSLPSAMKITVDGNVLPVTAISGERIDLLPYLQKSSDGVIQRGRYAEIVLAPNDLARINATVSSRLFIQSQIGTVA